MKTNLIILFSFFLFQPLLFAQSNNAIEIFNNRNENLNYTINSLNKIKKSNNSNENQLLSNSLIALTYITKKDYNKTKEYISEAEKFSKKGTISEGEAFLLYATARLYLVLDDDEHSSKYFLESLNMFKKLNNFGYASDAAVSIAYFSKYQNPNIFGEALNLANQSKDIGFIINARSCYANYMKDDITNDKKSKFNANQMLDYLKETIDLVKDKSEIKQKFYLATLYFNYGYNLLLFKNDQNGDFYLNKALAIAKKYNYQTIFRNYYGAKGSVLLENGKTDEAKIFFLKGLDEIKKISYPEVSTEILFYRDLKDIAAKQKDWEEFYHLDQKYQELSEKLNDENINKAIQNSLIKYEMKEKQEKIDLLTSKNFNQKIYILIMILAIILMVIIWFQYQKNSKLKLRLISEKNKKLEIDKNQVQKELMSSVLHLEKKNEILNDLKEKLLEKNLQTPKSIDSKIFKTIDEGILVDDDFEKFKSNFNTIYPEFFNKLLEKANQNLTQLDLKYCGFILMKLSNKEIASQMNVEPKSIRMARYRIKQKLNLGKDEDLDQFIQEIS